jgi:hypothetical protein
MASHFNVGMARAALLDLAKSLTSRDAALRRDECSEWRIDGRRGHVYAVPGTLDDPDRPGFMIHVLNEKLERGTVDRWTPRGWKCAKRVLFVRQADPGRGSGGYIFPRSVSVARRGGEDPAPLRDSKEARTKRGGTRAASPANR